MNTPKRLVANVVDEVHLKRRKRRRLNNSNDGGQEVTDEVHKQSDRNEVVESPVLKVPPLKIFFQSKDSGSVIRLPERDESTDQHPLG